MQIKTVKTIMAFKDITTQNQEPEPKKSLNCEEKVNSRFKNPENSLKATARISTMGAKI